MLPKSTLIDSVSNASQSDKRCSSSRGWVKGWETIYVSQCELWESVRGLRGVIYGSYARGGQGRDAAGYSGMSSEQSQTMLKSWSTGEID
jgi:hypothetical protein